MDSSPSRGLFCEVTEDWQREYIRERLGGRLAVDFTGSSLQQTSVGETDEVDVISVFVGSACNAKNLSSFPSLELICTRSTGFDHIDLTYCRENDITVCNVPTYGDNTVAEHTFALILTLSRHVHEAVQKTKRGDFEFGGIRGFDLRGKTLGVVGTGHIGIHVIKMARGFGMNVLATDPVENDFMAELLSYDYVDLESLLGDSDIISLHTPLNESTRHLIDREALSLCRDHALIINTARGEIVDTDALHEALQENRLGGAGLDVIEGEGDILSDARLNEKEFSRERLQQLVERKELLRRDDVVFTPHMGYNSQEAVERILQTTAENVRRFLDSDPKNVVSGDTNSADD